MPPTPGAIRYRRRIASATLVLASARPRTAVQQALISRASWCFAGRQSHHEAMRGLSGLHTVCRTYRRELDTAWRRLPLQPRPVYVLPCVLAWPMYVRARVLALARSPRSSVQAWLHPAASMRSASRPCRAFVLTSSARPWTLSLHGWYAGNGLRGSLSWMAL